MRLRIFAALVALLPIGQGYSQILTYDRDATVTINVTVFDFETMKPLPNTRVTLLEGVISEDETFEPIEGKTDDSGLVVFDSVPKIEFLLRVRQNGYMPKDHSIFRLFDIHETERDVEIKLRSVEFATIDIDKSKDLILGKTCREAIKILHFDIEQVGHLVTTDSTGLSMTDCMNSYTSDTTSVLMHFKPKKGRFTKYDLLDEVVTCLEWWNRKTKKGGTYGDCKKTYFYKKI